MNNQSFSYLFKYVIVGESGSNSAYRRCWKELSCPQLYRTKAKETTPNHDCLRVCLSSFKD